MIPKYLRPFLWSYDVENLDSRRDKKVIITGILNLGSGRATKWLFREYSRDQIKAVIRGSSKGQWDKKSLNLWKMVFNIDSSEIKDRKIN